jgi:hypothetical protein
MLSKAKEDERELTMMLLVQMYENMSARTYSSIIDAKSEGNRTKEQVVFDILTEVFEKESKK